MSNNHTKNKKMWFIYSAKPNILVVNRDLQICRKFSEFGRKFLQPICNSLHFPRQTKYILVHMFTSKKRKFWLHCTHYTLCSGTYSKSRLVRTSIHFIHIRRYKYRCTLSSLCLISYINIRRSCKKAELDKFYL